jgi:hypothetical protein
MYETKGLLIMYMSLFTSAASGPVIAFCKPALKLACNIAAVRVLPLNQPVERHKKIMDVAEAVSIEERV